jgi:hypothetical protein
VSLIAEGLVWFTENVLVRSFFIIDSPYNGFGGIWDDAFMHNLEILPYLVTIAVMIAGVALPLSKRPDLDYPSLGIGVIKVILIVALGRPAIHLAVQLTNAVIRHILPPEGTPIALVSYVIEFQVADFGNIAAMVAVGSVLLFLGLFGLLAITVLVSLTKFMVFATYILLPILAPLLVFDFGPLNSYAKPAKIQVGATFALLFMMILFAGYMQVTAASMGWYSSEDVDLSNNAEVRNAVDELNASDRFSLVFIGTMGYLAPLFIAKRFMGMAVSTEGDAGLRGTRGSSSSSSSSSSGSGAASGSGGSASGAGGEAAASSPGGSGASAGSATSSSAGGAAASSGGTTAGASSGASAGGAAGPVGSIVGATVGAASGYVAEKIGEQGAKQRWEKKGGNTGKEVGDKISSSTAGSAVKTAGKGVRHMMANPHGNPLAYGAAGLRHGYNKAQGISAVSPDGPSDPSHAGGLPAGQPLPAPGDGPDTATDEKTIQGKSSDLSTLEGTYHRERTEWGTGNEEVGYISTDDAPMDLPIRTRTGDDINSEALEDGAQVRMTDMNPSTTTQGTPGSHSPDKAMPADSDGEEYTTFVPSDHTTVERVD